MDRRLRKPKYTRLILFSGGIDSTFLLAQALRDTEDTVLVHHVNLINQEVRHRAEAEACAKIANYCRSKYRDFLYTESTVDRRGFKAMGYDVITVAAEGGIAASNYYLETGKMPDFWMLGLNAEEALVVDEAVHHDDLQVEGAKIAQKPADNRLNFILAAMAASCFPNAPPKYLQPVAKPKRDLMNYMGQELVDLCWTCRRPIEKDGLFHECGECQTCKLMNTIRG